MGIISQEKHSLDALFTRTQRQLLGLFFGQPGRSFYLNEIVRLAEVGTGSVQRELQRFSKSGLLTVRRIGNQKHYQANPELPILEELHGLVRKTFGIVETVRQALAALPARPDLAVLYQAPEDESSPALRVMLVSDRLDLAMVGAALAEAGERLGRHIRPWLLDRHRFRDLRARDDIRLETVLNGPKVSLDGSFEPSDWNQ